MKAKVIIQVLLSCLLYAGCASDGCNKKKSDPTIPDKDPAIAANSAAARDAITNAVTNSDNIGKKSVELKTNVTDAKSAVDAMVPVVDAAKAAGGPAKDVGVKVEPLQKKAADNLGDASKKVDELQAQNVDLKNNLIKAEERIKSQDQSINKWDSDWKKHIDADVSKDLAHAAEIKDLKEQISKQAKEIVDLKESNEGWYAYIKGIIFVVSLALMAGAIVVLLWLKEKWIATGMAAGAIALPTGYFILRTVFKLEKPIMYGFGAFFLACFFGALYYIFKYRNLLIKSIIGFDFQKDKTWNGDTKPIVTKIMGSAFDDIEAIKNEFLRHDKDGNIVMPNNTIVPVTDAARAATQKPAAAAAPITSVN